LTNKILFGKCSPFHLFLAKEWASLSDNKAFTLTCDEIKRLKSIGDQVDLEEVQHIYLLLSYLLSKRVESNQKLFQRQHCFLQMRTAVKTPFIIGIAGSVAVGKSTTAHIFQELLKRWPSISKVDLLSIDGFLYSNAVLRAQNKMDRKGFPESYDTRLLLRFLVNIKAGLGNVKAPLYSHLSYDVSKGKYITIDRPDILIIEGINVLQMHDLSQDDKETLFVSDFLDFSIYIDAKTTNIRRWYLDRFMQLREASFQNPKSFFSRYANMKAEKACKIAEEVWINVNLKNLEENILPTRSHADLILYKGPKHTIKKIALRKL